MAKYNTDNSENLSKAEDIVAGYAYKRFTALPLNDSFNASDWSGLLHISERTLLRYKQDNKRFDPLQTDRILVLNRLIEFGNDILGKENLKKWLETDNLALGGKKPKELLVTSFGIELVQNELGRIAHGVLA